MNGSAVYHGKRPSQGNRLLKVLLALILTGAICFLIPFSAVLLGSRDVLTGDPQVMVIFGCQVMPWGPSILLQDRLDTALDYLEDHPDVQVIVSGGQGPDEHISEAQCMAEYLTEHGLDEERILQEDRSLNTNQNVHYTLDLMEQQGMDPHQDVILVSNGFHLTRITMLWQRTAGKEGDISTLAAPSSHFPTMLAMHVREPLALVKSFFLDWDV